VEVEGVPDELIARARAGDNDAFRALTEPHRRELQVHCYRMLGSLQDAEDALQGTLLAAWQGLDGYAGRASIRTWLYRIATNQCLDALRSARRRPAKAWDVAGIVPPEPTRLGEIPWLEPFPDALLDDALGVPLGPEARYEQTESISLAFVTALQVLPPRQLAVLVLRDVLGFHAREVAEMLDTTVESVTSALKRARAGLPGAGDRERIPVAGSPLEQVLAAEFVRAYEAADIDAVVALLTDDIFMSMPPVPLEYEGRDIVARFLADVIRPDRRFDLVPTRANGQPAFGTYLRAPDGTRPAIGLVVIALRGDRIRSLIRFEDSVLPWFGLPQSLPRD
jgi:RNA polymerase sigma-70 factor (TIGR02960 family)